MEYDGGIWDTRCGADRPRGRPRPRISPVVSGARTKDKVENDGMWLTIPAGRWRSKQRSCMREHAGREKKNE